MTFEADPRHVELLVKHLKLEMAMTVATPGENATPQADDDKK